MKRARSSKRALASIVLGFESFVVFFATLAAFGLKTAGASDALPPIEWIWAIGLTWAILCILTPALLSRQWGYWLGSILQAGVLFSGFYLWGMFIIGAALTGMWIWALVAGSTIDRGREAYLKQKEEEEKND
jgi:hypothetical protein